MAQLEAKHHRNLYACAKKRYFKNNPCIKLHGPHPLIYYYRFGFQSHNIKRASRVCKNNKFSHFRNTTHNNTHANWVYKTYFSTQEQDDLLQEEVSNTTNRSIPRQIILAVHDDIITHRIHGKRPKPFASRDPTKLVCPMTYIYIYPPPCLAPMECS